MNLTAGKTRIVRRAVLVVAAIALLPAEYVGSWLALSRAVNSGAVSINAGQALRPCFKPLILYCDMRKPGAELLNRLWWSVSTTSDVGTKQQGWFLAPSLPQPK